MISSLFFSYPSKHSRRDVVDLLSWGEAVDLWMEENRFKLNTSCTVTVTVYTLQFSVNTNITSGQASSISEGVYLWSGDLLDSRLFEQQVKAVVTETIEHFPFMQFYLITITATLPPLLQCGPQIYIIYMYLFIFHISKMPISLRQGLWAVYNIILDTNALKTIQIVRVGYNSGCCKHVTPMLQDFRAGGF